MSPSPQLSAVVLRLTKNRPSPRTGVGQKSSAAELIGSPRFSGAPKGASELIRRATQISSPPYPPGRFDAMYRLSPSGAWIGQPSSDGVFNSELLAAISSIFWAGAQAEKCAASAAAADTRLPIATANASVIDLRILVLPFSTCVVALDEQDGHSWACDGACDGGKLDVGLSVHLLGPPRMEVAGTLVENPRGHKAWGLLTYLLRSRVPPSRERVASLLFSEADDPLGALRWTLSALRRRLGEEAELGGDPLRLALPPGTYVDVDVLSRGSWVEAIALPGLGHGLLEGLAFRSSPGFEMWLESERRHVAGTTSAVLHEAALALLARGEAAGAAHHAAELVGLNPYEENAHVLLVRCLRVAGDPEAAAHHVEACTELFRRELGIEPTAALRTAAVASEVAAAAHVSGRATVQAQVEAGESAIASSSRRRWSRSGARSSTLPAAPTRKAPPPCTTGRRSPSMLGGSTSPR